MGHVDGKVVVIEEYVEGKFEGREVGIGEDRKMGFEVGGTIGGNVVLIIGTFDNTDDGG